MDPEYTSSVEFSGSYQFSCGGGLGRAADLFCDGAVRGARAVRAAAGTANPDFVDAAAGGNLRDPLVGRDLLIGAVYGVVIFVVEASDNFLLPLFGKLPPIPGGVSTESLLGLRHAVAQVLLYVLGQTIDSLGIFFILFILQRILRSAGRGDCGGRPGTLLSLGNNGGEYPWISAVFLVVLYLSFLLVLKRFGLLVLVVGLVVQSVSCNSRRRFTCRGGMQRLR